jgi:AAA domain-containing protein/relaxase-like protein
MNPRINVGRGVTGAVNYVFGPGRDPKTGHLKPEPEDGQSRVKWIGGTGFGFEIKTKGDADLARRIMEFDSLNGATQCRMDCVHISLSWRPGENPTRKQMEAAAHSALASLGMANAKAIFVAHNDEDYEHVHIIAWKINPDTGRVYDLKGSWRTLSRWAEQYERENGGIISTRRQLMNELRSAIADRDADAVLEAMTKQRSTFAEDQLDRALQKEIQAMPGAPLEQVASIEADRNQFKREILGHADVVRLADQPGGPVTRYTTQSVLEAEMHVLRAAKELAASTDHYVGTGARAAIETSGKFATMTLEQVRAFRHATASQGLALIDGQAGTGKSFTIAAIREAYEIAGYRVVGLAPTNAVARDMEVQGFTHGRTVHSELFALANERTTWTGKTAVIVDEAAMLDTKLMAMVTAWASDTGAKLILVGDDRQLSSIDRGGMFGALKDRYDAAALSDVKRQHKNDERRAAEMLAGGNFSDALRIYDQKGAIHWTRTQGEARAELVEQWAKDSANDPDKSRFVFAFCNDDVATLNAALREVRKGRGELGPDQMLPTAHGRFNFAVGDSIQFTANDKAAGITNGHTVTIEAIEVTHITAKLDGPKPKTINFDAAAFDEFRHGMAGTIYRGQGKTLDQTYLYYSEHWRSAASYVALTRHREKTELFVARNTAKDLETLARQMARTDERRAASVFYPLDKIDPVHVLTPAELNAHFAPALARRDREYQRPIIQDNQPRHELIPACAPQHYEHSIFDEYPGLTRGDAGDDRSRTRSR